MLSLLPAAIGPAAAAQAIPLEVNFLALAIALVVSALVAWCGHRYHRTAALRRPEAEAFFVPPEELGPVH